MPANKKPRRPAAEPRRIKEFEGVRSKPARGGGGRARLNNSEEDQPTPRHQGADAGTRPAERVRDQGPDKRIDDASSNVGDAGPLVDPRSDPEVMFRILSEKIAAKVDRAAMKAGASAAQEVGRRLTAELDAAIAGAQSTAGKMGSLVQQAVQAAVDEALRTAVLNATRVHEEHLAQLALIDRTAHTAENIGAVRMRIEEEMRRSGLTRVTAPDPESFNLVNPTEHAGSTAYEVLAPAYADSRSGRIIQRGEMRRMPSAAVPVAQSGEDR
ncbi:hypothetical protein SY2F82_41390 [Streptomyces sp. Y2F8-2]|uniref:hypothetical protein n=1 Tax=Streptomyces sp. Y2F8-2 TaxID=2759675 RepID=UPI0019057797|nr:hypothetical protein [Streptomyces sp. Y2F8-2]GHK02342.1 hypothetical protein SY2F82_41390 [Streptomyces sp. Y2F8-2]